MSQLITFFDDQLVNALGWTFIHTLWQGCLIVLIMIFVLQRIPAKQAVKRYTIATASMLSILVAAVATFVLLYFEPGKMAATAASTGPATVIHTTAEGVSLIQWLSGYLPALVVIWIGGVALLSLRLVFGMTYIFHLKRSASDLTYSLGDKARKIAKNMRYSRPLLVAESALVKIPVVVGHLKPMILFPIGAINQLTTEETEAVLAHEIAHLVRNDFIHNLIQSAIEVIFYYHPAVWWISAVVRAERENCCDDLAIQVCGSSLTYARALVRLQEVGGSSPALALPFSGSKHHLLDRVKRILNQPQNKSNLMEKITATTLLLLCLIFASFSEGTDTQRPVVDVPKLIHEYHAQFANHFVKDTIIPNVRYTIVHEEENGKEIRLSMENGEIKSLEVDGREIPESEYGTYQDEIDRLQSQVVNVPAPPVAPMPPMPDMPPMPVMPDMPPMPEMPPAPQVAPMPPMPPMPDMPPAPAAPDFNFGFDFDINPEVEVLVEVAPEAGSSSSKQSSKSVIIRERDEDGSFHYRVEGDNPNIQIDPAVGIAFIDGQEVTLDSDSVIVIEEIETTHNGFAYEVAPNFKWNSEEWSRQWNETVNSPEWQAQWEQWSKEWKDNWNSEAWQKQWKEAQEHNGEWQKQWTQEWKEQWSRDGEQWQEYSDEIRQRIQEHQNSPEWQEYKEKIQKYKEDLDTDDAKYNYFYEIRTSSDSLRERAREYETRAKELRERNRNEFYFETDEARDLERKARKKKDGDNDQSSVIQEYEHLIAVAPTGSPQRVLFVESTPHLAGSNVAYTADIVEVDGDTEMITLTGNVNLTADNNLLTADKIVYRIAGADSENIAVSAISAPSEVVTIDVLGASDEKPDQVVIKLKMDASAQPDNAKRDEVEKDDVRKVRRTKF